MCIINADIVDHTTQLLPLTYVLSSDCMTNVKKWSGSSSLRCFTVYGGLSKNTWKHHCGSFWRRQKNVDNIRMTKVLEGWFRSDHVMTEDQWGHMGQITPIMGCFFLPTSGHWFSVVIVHDGMDWTHSSLFLITCYFPCWWHKESFPCDMFNCGSADGCLRSFQRVRGLLKMSPKV